ncbi:hypothetical protein [Geoalkalibacter subterraneus]|uniref:Uncharacterized protein n=1 Tax=Geoalkalibacter subterraneus TaxID=483547 RepID=A0A0B5FX71_9BACT|nr:hypothetical protein [Geoalkalibacter subterraneus]AJF08201.1 hypothetical protein GSUB_17070 [Geoalkalibacter subterraneus]
MPELNAPCERTHNAQWQVGTPRYFRERFPLPAAPSPDASPLYFVEVWENNAGACLTLTFTPAFWFLSDDGLCTLNPPRLELERSETFHPAARKPSGYFHFVAEKTFEVSSHLLVRDSFTRTLDEYFVARFWDGERNCVEGINDLPGIGATIQRRHFSKAPHEILGKTVFYA